MNAITSSITWAQDTTKISLVLEGADYTGRINLACHGYKLRKWDKTVKERSLWSANKSATWNSTFVRNRQVILAQNFHWQLREELNNCGHLLAAAAQAWAILHQERECYFSTKQAQLVGQLNDAGVPPAIVLEVLRSFSQHFAPAPADRQVGAHRTLGRILGNRMSKALEVAGQDLRLLVGCYTCELSYVCLWAYLQQSLKVSETNPTAAL